MLLNNKFPIRYTIRKIWFDLCIVLFVGFCAQYFSGQYDKFLPPMPLSIPIFLGTAISILLSFKMNQSYDRWWEARKIWGSIVNDSRNLLIQLQAYVPKEHHATIRTMAYRQIAWCYCLGQSLRGLPPLDNLQEFLSVDDMEAIKKHNNKPLAIVQLNAQDLRQLKDAGALDSFTYVKLNSTLCAMIDYMGMAERINSTVFPVTYRYYLHFTIYIFIITFSIAMDDVRAVFVLPMLVIISACFFLIEKSALHLQDPFRNRPSDTPMTTIARNIEINLKQLLGESNVPEPLAPKGFYMS